MIIDSPVFAPNSVLPSTGVEGQTVVVSGVGTYNYINGAWVRALDSAAVAGSAAKLATARTINGVPFDGTTNIVISDGGTAGEPVIAAGTTSQYFRGDKTWHALDKTAVGLSNVDNTPDTAKPVSTAQQTALNLKLDATATATAATKLATARSINGVAFDGTADITLSADASKEPVITAGTTGQYFRGDKTFQTLDKTAVGLSNVDNTADTAKPVSTAQQTALDLKLDKTANAASATKLVTSRSINGVAFDGTADITISTADASKEPVIAAGTTSQYFRGDKTFQTLDKTAVGLSNVDNTADTAKPVSTAQQTALNLKLDASATAVAATKLATSRTINGVAFDGTSNITIGTADGTKEPVITGGTTGQYWRGDKTFQTLDKTAVGLSNVDNTADTAKPVSTAQQTALNLKLDASATAAAATKLATARTINGVAFDGTANITLGTDPSKEPAITAGTTLQYFRGDKTFVDFATSVNATALTGLSTSTATAVVSTDTHVVGVGKLQAQVTGLVKVAAVSAAAVDCSLGSYFTKTITATTNFTVTNVPASGTCASIMLELTNGGSQTVTWFTGVTWAGGVAPTLTASGVDVLGFYTLNGGTSWRGFLMAKDIK